MGLWACVGGILLIALIVLIDVGELFLTVGGNRNSLDCNN